jgi:tetratricopeptide (TPR) repeat protein
MKDIQTWLTVLIFVICAPAFADEANSNNTNDPFQDVVASYRAANPKPVLPEEARKFKLQAEFAVQEKQFDRAVELYGKALEIAPWWPEGHFNRALILGETKKYEDAAREMKRYLLLVPDASDSRQAQDKIYQWEGVAEADAVAAKAALIKAVWTDPNTGLMWQRADDGFKRNQDDSISYCQSLSLGNHSDWRLPSRKELLNLWRNIGSQAAIRKAEFPTMKSDGYWSIGANWAGGAWPVDFSDGSDWHVNKDNREYVRCVRTSSTSIVK